MIHTLELKIYTILGSILKLHGANRSTIWPTTWINMDQMQCSGMKRPYLAIGGQPSSNAIKFHALNIPLLLHYTLKIQPNGRGKFFIQPSPPRGYEFLDSLTLKMPNASGQCTFNQTPMEHDENFKKEKRLPYWEDWGNFWFFFYSEKNGI